MLPSWATPEKLAEAEATFRAHNVTGPIWLMLDQQTSDEAIFLVDKRAAETVDRSALDQALTALTRRKTWVTAVGPTWLKQPHTLLFER